MNKDTLLNHISLCPLPWNGIYVNPDGQIKNCAINNQTLGNINQEPLHNIVNNSINQTIRNDMLNGVRHTRCNTCYLVEDNSLDTNDNESNRSWYKKIAINNSNLDIFDNNKNFEPIVLDLRWRNTCNYACAYCGPDLSSTWESLASDSKFVPNEHILDQSKQYIFDRLLNVKHVYLAGGEPLLMKDNVELLNRLHDVNPNVELRINSNISNLNGPVYALLKKFKNVNWTVSVDSRYENFEYTRWPGKWNNFVKNVLLVKDQVGDQMNFNMVWSILNSDEIFDTFDTLLDLGFHENMFIVQCLRDPSPLNVLQLPPSHINELKLKIKNHMNRSNPEWWLYKSLTSMYNFLNNAGLSRENTSNRILQDTIDFLTKIDDLRGTSSRAVFKELYNIYDSN